MPEDLLGKPMSETDAQFVRLYGELKALAAREDLPPCAERNVKKALACLWQVVNDLDLEFEQLYEVGV
ncbi:MAG TPA: hypothetical protein VM364_01780 [Vicinamibacterales bacterium]|nr:hypothetical protein [Vicinamibacterales bacterium]